MCSRCLRQCTKTEIEQPEVDELWALFRAAYEQYQLEIVNGNKLYKRFVNDFISYHLPFFTDDEHLIRMHIRNLSSVYELLTERNDLIDIYFNKDSFVYENYVTMTEQFNTVKRVYDYNVEMGWFNDDQLAILVKYINEEEIFEEDITVSELRDFFGCSLEKPLVVRKMAWFLLLLNALAYRELLVRCWQKLIAENKLLQSNKSSKPVTITAISSNISRKRKDFVDDGSAIVPFNNLIEKLKLYVK